MPAECPSDRALSGFAAGELEPTESTAVSEHVRACPACSDRVRAFEPSPPTDPLLEDLRHAPPPAPSDPEFLAAVDRLLAEPLDLLPLPGPGDVLDDYRLVELLGAGGMGVVYRAVHTRLDREVAVKVIRSSRAVDPHAGVRFAREMRAAGKVRHPNLVQATDAGVAGGVQYLVMEYVPGTDLARLVVRDGTLPPDRACAIVRQAADGLHHAHQHGLVHRDVKPSNLLLGADGVVRVLDLGLALAPGDPVESFADTSPGPDDTLTSPGQRLGTRHYTAPEQLRDSHRVDPRADVYGLGCTLVYLLTGEPYRSGVPYPSELPRSLWERLLAPDPAGRFASAADAAAALAPFCARPRRSWLLPAVALVVVIATVAAVLRKPEEPAPPPAPAPTPAPAEPVVAPPPRAVPPRGMLPLTSDEGQELRKLWAAHVGRPLTERNTIGMELVLIPPGEFALSRLYSAAITKPYFIGAHEVTAGQFALFAAETGHKTPAELVKIASGFQTHRKRSEFPHPFGNPVHRLAPGWGKYDDDQPIGYVNWDDVDAFLTWLSHREGRRYRLPTLAEWTWAARAGTITQWYWGDNLQEQGKYAWARASGVDRPQPVGRLLPNPWGLYDMLGNVEELVRDYAALDYNPAGRAVDPTGPPPTANRITCGGSYYEFLHAITDAPRAGAALRTVVYSTQGFRVVCEP